MVYYNNCKYIECQQTITAVNCMDDDPVNYVAIIGKPKELFADK